MTDILSQQLKANLRGDFELGKRLSDIAIQQYPDNPAVQFNRGWHLCQEGDLLGGFKLLQAGRWRDAFGAAPLGAGTPIWQDEPLQGRTVLFRSEGGYGDEIIFARFARNFAERGTRVILSCSRSMFSLFRQLDVQALVDRDHAVGIDHDYWIPAMAAPMLLGTTYDMLSGAPYLKATPRKLSGEFKVGLRWSGLPDFEHEQYRRFPRELMLDLLSIKGPKFYSLQRDENVLDEPVDGLTDLKDNMKSWKDTAEIIAGLDLVITSCTSIAHLAGALGVPTWVVVPILPYYIWALPGNKSPWYDSVRLYRQEQFGEWEQPFSRVRRDLEGLCGHLSKTAA